MFLATSQVTGPLQVVRSRSPAQRLSPGQRPDDPAFPGRRMVTSDSRSAWMLLARTPVTTPGGDKTENANSREIDGGCGSTNVQGTQGLEWVNHSSEG